MFDFISVAVLVLEVTLGLALLAWLFRFVPRSTTDEQSHREYFIDDNPRYQTSKSSDSDI